MTVELQVACRDCGNPIGKDMAAIKATKCAPCAADDLYARYGDRADLYAAPAFPVGVAYTRLLARRNRPTRFQKWYER